MGRPAIELLATEWSELLASFSAPIRRNVAELAQQHHDALATHFYEHMLRDPGAMQFLSHDQVKTRLHSSMGRWITGLFASGPDDDLQSVIAHQSQIGEVHARIDLPVHIVLRGARTLKSKFSALLAQSAVLDGVQRFEAIRFVSASIDMAMEIMSNAYSSSRDRNARAEESYRLFSVAQNVAAEKERQRAALLDWENQLMFDRAIGLAATQLPRLGASEFGLWFRHKGAHAFQGASETTLILDAIRYIDDVLLPMSAAPDEDAAQRIQRLRDLREQAKGIGFHLDRLFEQHSELEAGRDALTRLLSRKFLSVVLSKEVSYARSTGTSFAVLAVDIDHFKNVNDSYGHEAGDMVLQQFAAVLSNSGRAGDYVFRLGGEEFLMVLVDVDMDGARRAAEKLRRLTAAEVFRLPQERTLQVTVSIGLSLHDGHPDFLRTLRRADAALYRAKHEGRNRVVEQLQ